MHQGDQRHVPSGPPALNGPRVVAIRPGTPFLHAIPATGARPRVFTVDGLPEGLVLDAATGHITGTAPPRGEYAVRVSVANDAGRADQTLTIVAGDRLALTPPMGWMSWNMFGRHISDRLITRTADAMLLSGMRDVGYEYVCIDDHWHGGRNPDGTLYPDTEKFPGGIASLADYLHERGLKLGIYSDAGTMTCGGEPGSFGFEEQDAHTFASWGVDYLKYDYCNAPVDRPTAIERYTAMGRALERTSRSIVFAVCEWGVRQPWEWAPDAGGHLWRTTADISDTWAVPPDMTEFTGIVDALDLQVGLDEFGGRGWHDPDMLVVGLNGQGMQSSGVPHPGCTVEEYRSQMSLWSVLGAPLLASCDLITMDEATRETLTNPEVVGVNQDPLGMPGRRLGAEGGIEMWARPLAGDATAFALVNRGEDREEGVVPFERLGLSRPQRARDLWRHRDLDDRPGGVAVAVEPHETAVVICRPA